MKNVYLTLGTRGSPKIGRIGSSIGTARDEWKFLQRIHEMELHIMVLFIN